MSRLWRSTLPMTLGIMGLLGFNLVDAAFVSHLGTAPLAAQSFTFPLTFLIIGVQVGMGIAIAAIVSRTLGAEDEARARRLGGVVLLGSGVLMALLMLLLWVIRVPA
ncbi:MATE family efflux transporter, partial [uncultured Cobetia sp.]